MPADLWGKGRAIRCTSMPPVNTAKGVCFFAWTDGVAGYSACGENLLRERRGAPPRD